METENSKSLVLNIDSAAEAIEVIARTIDPLAWNNDGTLPEATVRRGKNKARAMAAEILEALQQSEGEMQR